MSAGSLSSLPFARPNPLEPAEELARLRAEVPVCRVRAATGEPAWLVTRYDDARSVLTDRRFGLAFPGAAGGDVTSASLFQDPPGHTRLRRLVTGALTPRRVVALRPGSPRSPAVLSTGCWRSAPPSTSWRPSPSRCRSP
jgi:cytochrome P450